MSTARTENEMNWLSECCYGAPTPKEVANDSLFYQEEENKEFEKEIAKELLEYKKENDDELKKEHKEMEEYYKEMIKSKNKNI